MRDHYLHDHDTSTTTSTITTTAREETSIWNTNTEHESHHDSTATTTTTTSKDPGARGACAEDRGASATHGGGGRGRWGGERGGWGGGRRMRRGDIRRAILSALQEGPAHGYGVMRRLEEMSGGLWRPSPGSVYPHLQMLEDEGMVRFVREGRNPHLPPDRGRRGRSGQGRSPLPWQAEGENDDQIRNLRLAVTQLHGCGQATFGRR